MTKEELQKKREEAARDYETRMCGDGTISADFLAGCSFERSLAEEEINEQAERIKTLEAEIDSLGWELAEQAELNSIPDEIRLGKSTRF